MKLLLVSIVCQYYSVQNIQRIPSYDSHLLGNTTWILTLFRCYYMKNYQVFYLYIVKDPAITLIKQRGSGRYD